MLAYVLRAETCLSPLNRGLGAAANVAGDGLFNGPEEGLTRRVERVNLDRIPEAEPGCSRRPFVEHLERTFFIEACDAGLEISVRDRSRSNDRSGCEMPRSSEMRDQPREGELCVPVALRPADRFAVDADVDRSGEHVSLPVLT